MIDEKKLVEDIINTPSKVMNEIPYEATMFGNIQKRQNEILDVIDRQPKVSEWIPVSERLPNIKGVVLIQRGTFAEGKGKPLIQIAEYTTRRESLFKKKKGFYEAHHSMPWEYDDVIAWQPLPEPMRLE